MCVQRIQTYRAAFWERERVKSHERMERMTREQQGGAEYRGKIGTTRPIGLKVSHQTEL